MRSGTLQNWISMFIQHGHYLKWSIVNIYKSMWLWRGLNPRQSGKSFLKFISTDYLSSRLKEFIKLFLLKPPSSAARTPPGAYFL